MTGESLSITVLDLDTGETVDEHAGDVVRSTASVAKILLLAELSARLDADPGAMPYRLTRTANDTVGDSGLWQHLEVESLSVRDLAVLIGAVSDNLATNVLLRHLGLDAVAERARLFGLEHTALHDRVRDHRGPEHPQRLSSGTSNELARLMGALDERVLGWLRLGVDLSMVGAGLGLDPLAHGEPDRRLRFVNKTGTDVGVRCDVGRIEGPTRRLAYAVLANWTPSDPHDTQRDDVLAEMRSLGLDLARAVTED